MFDRQPLLIALILAVILPIWAAAGGLPEGVSQDRAKKTASENSNGSQESVKGFLDPRTGEVLTYEQARDAGITDSDQRTLSSGSDTETDAGGELRLGKRIPLKDGGYIAEIVSPLPYTKLKAKTSEDGKTKVSCHH